MQPGWTPSPQACISTHRRDAASPVDRFKQLVAPLPAADIPPHTAIDSNSASGRHQAAQPQTRTTPLPASSATRAMRSAERSRDSDHKSERGHCGASSNAAAIFDQLGPRPPPQSGESGHPVRSSCVPPCRCRIVAKNLRVRTPQIVPIQQRQIGKLPATISGTHNSNRIPCRWRLDTDQVRLAQPCRRSQSPLPHHRKPQLHRLGIRAEIHRSDRGLGAMWREFLRPRQQLPRASIRTRQPQKHLVPMRIQRRRLHPRLRRQHRQPRHRNHRNLPRLRQPLHRAQPHAHAR